MAQRDVKAVVRGIEKRYDEARTLKATFLERYSEGKNDVRIESGTVYFSRPGRMRWDYEEPEEKFFLSDGRTVWFYVPADRTVTRAKIKESADWRTPLALLTGKAKLSRVCGRIELVEDPERSRRADREPRRFGTGRISAPGNTALRCLPRQRDDGQAKGQPARRMAGDEEASNFQEVLLEVDSGYRLVRILVREAGGIETELRFANWEENIPIREVLFHFQAPPGVAIVEESSIAGPVR